MIFTIGVIFMMAGWVLAWHFGKLSRFEYDWCDKAGTGMFAVGMGLSMASTILFAIKHMP